MDKETLSNYGWIVILVLILAVMLALATPFGSFIAGAIKSTTAGFFSVNQSALNSTGLINVGDQSFDDDGNGGESGGNTTCTNHVDADGDGICDTQGCNETVSGSGSTSGTYAATFADNSWDDIAAACQNDEVPSTWAVGDTKTMTIGEATYNVTIIGTNHDTYADGGIAPLTFQADIVSKHGMNSTDTQAGGWSGSEMYSYLNTELINDLEFASYIQPVVKSTNKGYADSGNVNATEAVNSNDKLFLLSKIEVFGTQSDEVYNLEGSQYAYYAAGHSVIKNYEGVVTSWWLRSPYHAYYIGGGFYYVNAGDNSYGIVSSPYGVAFGFCF